MSFNLQDVTNDPDLAEQATVLRSTGTFAAGGWQSTTQTLQWWGVVTVASDRQLESLPEADRVHGARVFISEQQLYVTAAQREDGTAGTSDVLLYNGHKYRVASVGPYQNRGGFYSAVALRMQGS